MRDQYIFDIPVYRKTHEEFNTEINRELAKRVERIVSCDPQRRPLNRETYGRQKDAVIAESGGPWQFNQIVGWLRLFAEGDKIGCHLWWVNAKRLNRRMQKKRFQLQTFSDVLGGGCRNKYSNEIYDILLKRLIEEAAEPQYKKRYIDLNVFRRVGPFIDWRGMLNQLIAQNR